MKSILKNNHDHTFKRIEFWNMADKMTLSKISDTI
jgi:hypothetical protein